MKSILFLNIQFEQIEIHKTSAQRQMSYTHSNILGFKAFIVYEVAKAIL